MESGDPSTTPPGSAGGAFATTHWSVVRDAGWAAAGEGEAALSRLCREYWPPLYAYVCRRGHSPEEAEDLTQEFFARLVSKQYVRQADPQRGRFRTFLLGALKHFLANEWDKLKAVKRGGRQVFVSWEALHGEEPGIPEPFQEATAEKEYDRRWVMVLLRQTLEALRQECAGKGEQRLFEALRGRLVEPDAPDAPHWREQAAALGFSEGALKMRAHRLRRRFGELLREAVSRTVRAPEEVEEEVRHLLTVWD